MKQLHDDNTALEKKKSDPCHVKAKKKIRFVSLRPVDVNVAKIGSGPSLHPTRTLGTRKTDGVSCTA